MDVARMQTETGWHVVHEASCASTNDLALALARERPEGRQVVVADAQVAGRGREGRAFASPAGGLYASLLLAVASEDVPATAVALVALAAAEAVEVVADVPVAIKWPNDLEVGGRKVGGILLEVAAPPGIVCAGIGINAGRAPTDLPDDVRPWITGLGDEAGGPVDRDALLRALLAAIDDVQARRAAPGGRDAIAEAWRARLAWIGQVVTCRYRGADVQGVLEDISLDRGLLIREEASAPVWRQAEHVQDLRPPGRTI